MQFKNLFNKQKAFTILSFWLLLITIVVISTTPTKGEMSAYMSSDELKFFEVEDLELSVEYNFSISYDDYFYAFDLGFLIFQKSSCENDSLVMTVDEINGIGYESAIYTAPKNGNYYFGVYVKNGENGLIDIVVKEKNTGIEKDVNYHFPDIGLDSMWWIWVIVGVGGVFTFIPIILVIVVGKKAIERQKVLAQEALARGEALPRIGRHKNKCPFCGVKLPDESLVTCPYCNAPILDE
ncbi:MAG: zinc ribbon domain-containing protein [Asgard group archaeon]|nr:zinc ribbon domain-containing protein [Asgard group archaeon]